MLAALAHYFRRGPRTKAPRKRAERLLYLPQSRELNLSSVRKEDGSTLLHQACIDGNARMVAHLVQFHPELLNLADSLGQSAIFHTLNKSEIFHLLLRCGADLNKIDKYGRSVLHYAIDSRINQVGLLLQHGANPNVVDKIDHTTSMQQWADRLEYGSVPERIGRLLYDYGANVWTEYLLTEQPARQYTEIFRHYDRLKILLAANIFGPLYDYRIVRTIGTYL